METRAKQQHHAVPHGNPDDSRSESSGETSSGDSGRGASEEEIPSASPSHGECLENNLGTIDRTLTKNSNVTTFTLTCTLLTFSTLSKTN